MSHPRSPHQKSQLNLAHDLVLAILEFRTYTETNTSYFTRVYNELRRRRFTMSPKRLEKIRDEMYRREAEINSLMLKLESAVVALQPSGFTDQRIKEEIFKEANEFHGRFITGVKNILSMT